MPSPRILLPAGTPDWAALRRELDAPGPFPDDVLAEAAQSAAAPRLPALDLTDVPFLTIDPEGSGDLDQALSLRRAGSGAGAGFRLQYAIADVAAFVRPGGALDAECLRRGATLYLPDLRVPLHPPVLSEGAASLLEGEVRPALVWTVVLGNDGEPVSTDVRRALVRSRRQLTYGQAQAALDDGTADEQLLLLREVGLLRQARARDRGAVELPTPEQEVADGPDGAPVLTLRAPLPVEGWNAQLSLLTGLVAARLMLDGGVGLLRTLPPAASDDVLALRRSALALGIAWPEGTSYGEVVSGLDPAQPTHAALLVLATRLLRGAGYTAFDGAPPEQPLHSALAAPYAHCTAPLRRLADRHVGEVCLALCAGEEVPAWARAALPELPALMTTAGRRSAALDRAVVDLAEALLLAPRVGEVFDGAVVEASSKGGGTVQLVDPPVRGKLSGDDLPLGQHLRVRLVTADPATRQVLFAPA